MTIITNMNMGRKLSYAEETQIYQQLAIMSGLGGNGYTTSLPVTGSNGSSLGDCTITIWETQDAAEAWVTFMNTFDPPPVSIVVQTV